MTRGSAANPSRPPEGIAAEPSVALGHPPLVERIRRIDPSFDGDFSKVSLAPPTSQATAAEGDSEAGGRRPIFS